MTAGWGVRTLRAGVFGSVCVLLAALGHTLMAGAAVPWWTLVAGALATWGAGWCLAGRERGLPLVVSVVVVAQGGLHAVFEFSGRGHVVGDPMAGDPMAGDHTAGSHMALGHIPSGHMSLDHMSSDYMDAAHTGMHHPMSIAHEMGHDMPHDMGDGASLGMFAAHTLAALLCGLWLGHGERAAFRILRAVAGWLAAPLRVVLLLPAPPVRPRPRARRARSDRAPRLLPLVHSLTSRGPPAGPAVV
ncbi:hypothetical protein ACFYZU_10455 [Streptomyces sp. NPDC001651]|uniref:hypothetical protein n=1 Tax=Streptomyces sp. NPDC001651 TaxID=3364596 RepID=UPI0036BF657D